MSSLAALTGLLGLFVPVIHISQFLRNYLLKIEAYPRLSKKHSIALGGMVPNLRTPVSRDSAAEGFVYTVGDIAAYRGH